MACHFADRRHPRAMRIVRTAQRAGAQARIATHPAFRAACPDALAHASAHGAAWPCDRLTTRMRIDA